MRAACALALTTLLAACGSSPPATTNAGDAHESIAEGLDCSNCHTPDGWRNESVAASGGGFDHSRTGFPLTGRHGTVPCTGCHQANREVTRDCVSCHEDDHQGELGGQCDQCHSARGWDRTRAIELHRRTLLPLTGMHVLADCTECHQRAGEREWTGVPADCFACHEDDYRRLDTHPNHQGDAMNPPFPRDCTACHRANGWTPAVIDPSALPLTAALSAPPDHDLRFAISFGVHRGLDCAACHVDLGAPAAVSCTGCHAHNPVRLASQHRSPLPDDARACLACHPGGSGR